MLFNSIAFLLFLPIVFAIYWFVFKNNFKAQNLLILISSYVFYGWWDYRFLGLIAFSTLLDYFIGLSIEKSDTKNSKKIFLWISIIVNIGVLLFFKYFNFFIDSFATAFPFLTSNHRLFNLNIILPVGISFYTFQTLSYNIDIYKKKINPTKNLIAFSAFVSFFPQLVAGPIERASHLLPQFLSKRTFNYQQAVSGVKLMIWGFYKKVVIADNAAIIVDGIFNQYQNQSSLSLIVGSLLFTFQIYCDFSGYSDIAIGLARLFNFDLMTNFKFPYFSKNISEFWKRWHISLSTWFRDYVYIPIGGNRGTKTKAIINVLIVFLISGFWHGANWTFVIWGILHGIFYIPQFLGLKTNLATSLKTLWTFIIVCFAWVFFRAKSIRNALEYLYLIFTSKHQGQYFNGTRKHLLITLIALLAIGFMLWAERKAKKNNYNEVLLTKPLLILVALATIFFGAYKNHTSFIYFQF